MSLCLRAQRAGKAKASSKLSHKHEHDHDTVDYLYQTLGATIDNGGYIFNKSKAKATDVTYPNTGLGKDFKTIASLIKSDINTKVYYLQVGSFDTHVNQKTKAGKSFSKYQCGRGSLCKRPEGKRAISKT